MCVSLLPFFENNIISIQLMLVRFLLFLGSPRQLFGCGSVAQTVLSRNTLGEPLTVHIGFSVGLMMAAYVAGGVSGKHKHRSVQVLSVVAPAAIHVFKHISFSLSLALIDLWL